MSVYTVCLEQTFYSQGQKKKKNHSPLHQKFNKGVDVLKLFAYRTYFIKVAIRYLLAYILGALAFFNSGLCGPQA